jgi:hypothetical protein
MVLPTFSLTELSIVRARPLPFGPLRYFSTGLASLAGPD